MRSGQSRSHPFHWISLAQKGPEKGGQGPGIAPVEQGCWPSPARGGGDISGKADEEGSASQQLLPDAEDKPPSTCRIRKTKDGTQQDYQLKRPGTQTAEECRQVDQARSFLSPLVFLRHARVSHKMTAERKASSG